MKKKSGIIAAREALLMRQQSAAGEMGAVGDRVRIVV